MIDIGLPGLDGYEVAHRIREAFGERPIILVALTGHADPEDRRRALESGFDAHMDIRLLWNKQQNYLGSHLGNKGELIEAMRFVERGLIKPVVDRTMELKELARAQDLMESNAVAGKIVMLPA